MKTTKKIIRELSINSFQNLPILHLPPIEATRETEQSFSSQLRHVCHNIGFFYVKNHGIQQSTHTNALNSSKMFFDLPLHEKLAIDYRKSPAFRGYMDLGCENTAGKIDRREQIEFGVESTLLQDACNDAPVWKRLIGPNQWPTSSVPTLKAHIIQYMNEMQFLSRRIMMFLAISLDLPRDYFNDTFRDCPNVQFKICRYPPVDAENENGLGVGPHTDSGYLSLLLQDDIGGLQVQNGDGEWIDVPNIDDTIVVNLGEMIQLATNGYYLATPHRVKNVKSSQSRQGRFSLPYFWNPRLDFTISRIDLPKSLLWERLKTSEESIDSTDSHGKSGNTLFSRYGDNAFKSLARSHPAVMERHHKGIL